MTILTENKNPKFEWGVNDCCLWTSDYVQKKIGKDYGQILRGKYSTRKEYIKTLKSMGYKSLKDFLIDVIEEPIIPVVKAENGDIILYKDEKGRYSLGICTGISSLFKTETGIVGIPTYDCDIAWRIK